MRIFHHLLFLKIHEHSLSLICFSKILYHIYSRMYDILIELHFDIFQHEKQLMENTTLTPSTDNFYWINRIIGALCDAHFPSFAFSKNSWTFFIFDLFFKNSLSYLFKNVRHFDWTAFWYLSTWEAVDGKYNSYSFNR